MKKTVNNSSGQGLVEVIIAVAIITTGIVGVITLTFSSLRSTETSIKQIVAANLAREGVEVVRNIRDSNWLADSVGTPVDWRTGLASGTDYDGAVAFDPALNLWTIDFTYDSPDDSELELYRDANGVYQPKFINPSGQTTGYSRFLEMKIICINKTNNNIRIVESGSSCPGGFEDFGLKVLSSVKWQEKTGPKIFTVEEDIYDWHNIW